MTQELFRHDQFRKCPKCGGMVNPSDEQTECISCAFVMLPLYYYDKKGDKVKKI